MPTKKENKQNKISLFKKIRSWWLKIISIILSFFGVSIILFLVYFLIIILINGGCVPDGNGICVSNKETDSLISEGIIYVLILAIPITLIIYKKAKWLFFITSILGITLIPILLTSF